MNKKQLQLEYEIMGREVEEIARSHNLSPRMLEYTIKEQGWQRLPIAETLSTWKHGENPTDDLLNQVSSNMRLIKTLQESELAPEIMVVKQALLSKCQTMIASVEEPSALKTLAETLKLLEPQVEITEGQDEGLKIMVVNQFGGSGSSDATLISENALSVGGGDREARGSTANATSIVVPLNGDNRDE